MHSRQLEQLARQRHAELASRTRLRTPPCLRRHRGADLRTSTGWAIVAIGLRIVTSGTQRTPVTQCH